MNFRIKAFLSHLLISLAIAAFSVCVVFLVWHPEPLAKAVGVTSVFYMMLAIDSILGPLLTLAVAKKGKKSLKFDLSVIAIIQISALIYGLYTISLGRPVYVAFDTNRFEVVQASSIPIEDLEKAPAPYNKKNWGRYDYVAVMTPKDDEDRSTRLFVELESGAAPSMRPTLYEPLADQYDNIQVKKSVDFDILKTFNAAEEVDAVLAKYPKAKGWIPLKAFEFSMVVLIEEDNTLHIVDLRPWA